MEDFSKYLELTKEVGEVAEIQNSVVYIKGLPEARPVEVIIFENGMIGQVLSLSEEYVETLILSEGNISKGLRAARTNSTIMAPAGNQLLGTIISPLGGAWGKTGSVISIGEQRPVDSVPVGISSRKNIDQSMETGVAVVDLLLPLGRGQRELVIGDRKTGKTAFVMQALLSHAHRNEIVIYAAIGKSSIDIKRSMAFVQNHQIEKNVIIIASASSDPAGLVYLTPYTAMSIAEFFRDQGRDVLLILDDMTTHAKYYREVSLLSRRFPGRGSYPGDIFYTHARLLERAGNFQKGSITCLPVAETVLGDISGYIQTNLMSITDGHLFFDGDLFDNGRRPAINPFLSVTRVGRQAQTPLLRDVSRELSSFLVEYDKLSEYTHFGAEVSEETRQLINRGQMLIELLQQPPELTFPVNIATFALVCLWGGKWRNQDADKMREDVNTMINSYITDANYKKQIDDYLSSSSNFVDLVNRYKQQN